MEQNSSSKNGGEMSVPHKESHFWDALIAWWPGAIIGAFAGIVTYLVRTVLTNQKQLTALQAEIKAREELRQREHEDLQEVKHDVKTLSNIIMQHFSAGDR